MRTHGLRPIAAFCAVGALVGTALVGAQSAPQTPPQTPAAAPAAQGGATQPQGQQPGQPAQGAVTFRVNIDLVSMDAIVRNNQDQFVADLGKDDFEVFEDGVKQEITSFTLVHGGRVHNLLTPPPPPTPEGIILPPSRPRNDTAGRIFLIIVDDLHLGFRNTGRIRDLFKRIAKNLIHDGDMFSIVSTGPSSLAIDPTYDRKVLDEAIKKITGNGLKPSDVIQGAESADGPSEVRYRAHVAFSTAYDMLRQMERITNRRKAVIWVSNGYDFNPFAESRLGEDPVFGGRFGQTREEGREQQRTRCRRTSSPTPTWRASWPRSRGRPTAPTPRSTPSTRAAWWPAAISTSSSTRWNTRNTCASRRTACACWRRKPAGLRWSTRTTSTRR